jgi:hypothetical protein
VTHLIRVATRFPHSTARPKWAVKDSNIAANQAFSSFVVAPVGALSARERLFLTRLRACSEAQSMRGERLGREERSSRQESERRSCSPAACKRCHQRCAVAGDIPDSIASTSSRRPRRPSLALRCSCIRASFGCEPWQTTASKEARTASQPFTTCRRTSPRHDDRRRDAQSRAGVAGTATARDARRSVRRHAHTSLMEAILALRGSLKRWSARNPSDGGIPCHFGGNGPKSLRGPCRCIHAGSGSCAGSRPSRGCSGSTAAHSRSSRAPGDASFATPRSAAPTRECCGGSVTRPRRRTRTYARAELSGHRRAGPSCRSVCSSPTCAATRN